jgi:hypothetical protein
MVRDRDGLSGSLLQIPFMPPEEPDQQQREKATGEKLTALPVYFPSYLAVMLCSAATRDGYFLPFSAGFNFILYNQALG